MQKLQQLLLKKKNCHLNSKCYFSLLSIAGKMLTRNLAEDVLPGSQCGFRPSRGTIDMIFVVSQIEEKCRAQHQTFFMAFIDLTKARPRQQSTSPRWHPCRRRNTSAETTRKSNVGSVVPPHLSEHCFPESLQTEAYATYNI